MARSLKRSIGLATFGAPVLLILTLAACGDDDSSLGTEVEIKPSSFVTTPSTTTPPTAVPGEATGEPGDTSPVAQVHVVQPGEFLSGIAADYEVEMEEIADYNSWSDGVSHPLFPDDQVRIPPGAMVPDPEDEEDTESTDEDSGDEDESETTDEDDPELCPDGEPRGTYTIREGDIPARVATALDVTLDQLEEANSGNPDYTSFIVGARINIPCGAEATETTDE